MAEFPIEIPGTLPSNWVQLIQSLAVMPLSTQELQSLNISTWGELQTWLNSQGFDLLWTMQPKLVGIVQAGGVDPATTTAVSTEVVRDITVSGGVASVLQSGGHSSIGLVPKVIAVGAALSLLVSTIGAGVVSDTVKENLVFSATPYTVDGENIPVIIDENGKTHFMEEFLEGIRAAAIEQGIFDTEGTPETDIHVETVISPFVSSKAMLDAWCDECINYATTAQNAWFSANNTAFPQAANDFWAQVFTDAMTWVKNVAPPLPNDCFYVVEQISTTSGLPYWIGFRVMICRNDPAQSVSAMRPLPSRADYFVKYDNQQVDFVANKTGTTNTPSFTVVNNTSVPNYSFAIYDRSSSDYYYPYSPSPGTVSIGSTLSFNQTYDSIQPGYIRSIGNGVTVRMYVINSTLSGGGVEGITTNPTVSSLIKDGTKTIADIFYDGVTPYTTSAPTDEDLENANNWFPVSINTEDVFTDGATEDDTETAPEGNVKPEVQPDILTYLQDYIKTLLDDIVIKVEDTGNTPPAEPPVLDGSSNGLWTIYNPSISEVHLFGAWLWSDSIIDQIIRQFNSPIDAIIGFHQIYCTPQTGTSKYIKAGYLDSPVTALEVTNQYAEINCGELSVNEYYGNVLDYDNTQVSVYLPFVGIVPLDTNIVMGSALEIIYRIDVFTGTCLAQIKVKKENSNAVMYAFEGNCAVQIPLTATTYTGMVGALISGISAGVSFATGNMLHAATSGINAVMSSMSGRTGTKQSGTMGSNAGALGIRKPYLILTRVASAMPAGFESVAGLPSTQLTQLSSLSGFTSIRNIHLEGIPGSAEEIDEIKSLLESGVIF